jgi:hypothetical protein
MHNSNLADALRRPEIDALENFAAALAGTDAKKAMLKATAAGIAAARSSIARDADLPQVASCGSYL